MARPCRGAVTARPRLDTVPILRFSNDARAVHQTFIRSRARHRRAMVEDIGGQVQRYECPECEAIRLLAKRQEEVECEECGATMEYSHGRVMENPASAMHVIEDDVREVKGEEDLRYR